MLALQCHAKLGQLRLCEVPVPKVTNPDDVIIRVSYAGLCGTDLHILSGEFTNAGSKFTTICHEFCGVVEAVGESAAKNFAKGDRVGVDPNRPCHQCKFCRRGEVHHCQNEGCRDATGVFRDGGMAAFCIVPEEQVHKLPEKLELTQGALCEPLSCVLHGWDRLKLTGSLNTDSRILITGAGIIGNLWACMFHHHGYKDVTVSEPSEGRRNITEKLAFGYKITTPSDLEKQEAGNDSELDGFDVVVECSGYPPALQQGVGWSARGATLLIFGCAPAGKAMQLCPEEVFRKELSILGCLINPTTYSRALKLAETMGDRYLNYQKLGIQTFKIQEYEEAIAILKRGEISKAVFKLAEI